jgi:dihydropteroate synthase
MSPFLCVPASSARPDAVRSAARLGTDYDADVTENHVTWKLPDRNIDCSERTLVMGILNVTPDSFSDGGRHFDQKVALAAGLQMVADGADILDVGGESTRPWSIAVPVQEELDRVLPVIRGLAVEVDVPISIDTRKCEVARAALEAGATIVNDVSAGEHDPDIIDVVRATGAGFVLMHMRGEPNTMTKLVDYDDVVGEVQDYLRHKVESMVDAGIALEALAIDPGLGFAKTTDQSLLLMKETGAFLEIGRPLLVGPSRKSFIGDILGTPVTDRIAGTAGAVAWMVAQGAHVVRVHDVKAIARVVKVVDAIRHATPEAARASVEGLLSPAPPP